MSKARILIADDEAIFTESLKKIYEESGFCVATCTDGGEFLPTVTKFHPDLVLLDIYLGVTNGLELLKQIKDDGWEMPVIIMTANANVALAVQAMKIGAVDFLVKPFDLTHLSLLIEKTLDQSRIRKHFRLLQSELEEQRTQSGIMGRSIALRRVLQTAERLALADTTTVLIEGESGTGKELLARFIYQKSPRAINQFLLVNCGAIPKDIEDGEFFGYGKGSVAGAEEKTRQGKFELADGGTIFLDEITDLSQEMQVKLLRLLKERRFSQSGGRSEISVDVRVIAASNRDLAREVEAGRFHEDLYHRLAVASIKIPPLRSRREDIQPIALAYLHEFSKRFSKSVHSLSPEALRLLESLPWPGNARELQNALERVVLITTSSVIGPEEFAFLRPADSVVSGKDQNSFVLEIPRTGAKMAEVMRDLILKTLAITNGNQVHAAKILGLTRSKLRYRMEQLGIHPVQRTYKVKAADKLEAFEL